MEGEFQRKVYYGFIGVLSGREGGREERERESVKTYFLECLVYNKTSDMAVVKFLLLCWLFSHLLLCAVFKGKDTFFCVSLGL